MFSRHATTDQPTRRASSSSAPAAISASAESQPAKRSSTAPGTSTSRAAALAWRIHRRHGSFRFCSIVSMTASAHRCNTDPSSFKRQRPLACGGTPGAARSSVAACAPPHFAKYSTSSARGKHLSIICTSLAPPTHQASATTPMPTNTERGRGVTPAPICAGRIRISAEYRAMPAGSLRRRRGRAFHVAARRHGM